MNGSAAKKKGKHSRRRLIEKKLKTGRKISPSTRSHWTGERMARAHQYTSKIVLHECSWISFRNSDEFFHRSGDEASDLRGRFDKVRIAKMSVPRRSAVSSMPEQLADQGQVLARHDGVTGGGMPKVMQPNPAELRVLADRAPTNSDVVRRSLLRVFRKKAGIGVASAGQRVDDRPDALAEQYGAGSGLGVGQVDRGLTDVTPAKIEHGELRHDSRTTLRKDSDNGQ